MRDAAFLILHADDGRVGVGEAAPLQGWSQESFEEAARALAALATDLGQRPLAAVSSKPWPRSVRFALETALADLQGTWPSHPGLRSTVALDAGRPWPNLAPAIKLKLGADPAADARGLAHAAAAPAHTWVIGDANRAWTVADVDRARRACAAAGLRYVEEPCAGAALLPADAHLVSIALDESVVEAVHAGLVSTRADGTLQGDLTPLSRLLGPAVSHLVLKPTVLGGWAITRALTAWARTHDRQVVITHALESPIAHAACRALAAEVAATTETVMGVGPHPGTAAARAAITDDVDLAAADTRRGAQG